MPRTGMSVAYAIVVLGVVPAWFAGALVRGAQAHELTKATESPRHAPRHGSHGHGDHEHPPIPAVYASAPIPPGVWTDPEVLARGEEIFAAKCALCHGRNGNGEGQVSAKLAPAPPDLTEPVMVAEMSGRYWLWRVSEGGLVEPFRSKGSSMPAWKAELSLEDRWAVIAYAHILSGHRGPHDADEHPEQRPKATLVSGEGTVVALRRERQQIVLEHGEIAGFMKAMTMGYAVAPPSLLEQVNPGDKVRFTIDTQARTITAIEKLHP